MPRRKTDYGRTAVYHWENVMLRDYLRDPMLDPAQCEEELVELQALMGVDLAIELRFRTSGKTAWSHSHSARYITFPPWACRSTVIAHELAHQLTSNTDQPHGPEFMWVFIQMISRRYGYDDPLMAFEPLARSARAASIRVAYSEPIYLCKLRGMARKIAAIKAQALDGLNLEL